MTNNKLTARRPHQRSTNPFFRSPFLSSFWDDDFFSRDLVPSREMNSFVPAVNISEDDKAWNIEISAAGFKKEDFSVRLDNDVLTISAETKDEKKQEEKNYRSREFRYGSFSRSFRLEREFVDEQNIAASYENGILNITVPKSEKAAKSEPKEIRIG
jgi:HSP20 family protein